MAYLFSIERRLNYNIYKNKSQILGRFGGLIAAGCRAVRRPFRYTLYTIFEIFGVKFFVVIL